MLVLCSRVIVLTSPSPVLHLCPLVWALLHLPSISSLVDPCVSHLSPNIPLQIHSPLSPLFSAPEARLMDDIKAIPNFLLTFGPSQKGFLRDLGKERVRGWGIYSSNSLLIRSPWEGPFLYWRWLILLKQPRALSLLDAVSHFLSSLPRSRGRHRAAVMSSGACPLSVLPLHPTHTFVPLTL